MNGLTLRISKNKIEKTKPSSGIPAIGFTKLFSDKYSQKDVKYNIFLNASNADEQLAELKKLLEKVNDNPDSDFMTFLVTVFLVGDPKHPVRCFLTRYVTKRVQMQKAFEDSLVNDLTNRLKFYDENTSIEQYTAVMRMILSCSENFLTGVAALKRIEIEIVVLTKDMFLYCVEKIRNNDNLSPTEKNKVFNLIHLILRVQLPIIQKCDEKHENKLHSLLPAINSCIKYVLLERDVPMDTKSVCGMLCLSIYMLNNGADYWAKILQTYNVDTEFEEILQNDYAQLTLYSAMAILIPIKKLQTTLVDDEIAIVMLTKKILYIGERYSSESALILCVTRAMLHLCKSLEKIEDENVGRRLINDILIFIWANLEHYMDSVRHLTAQGLGYIVKYCCKLKKQGHDQAINSLFKSVTSLPIDRRSYYVGVSALILELSATVVLEMMPDLILHLIDALNVQSVQAGATTTLETLLQKYIKEDDIEEIMKILILPLLEFVSNNKNSMEAGVLHIIENILAKAIMWDQNILNRILPYIEIKSNELGSNETMTSEDLKCILVLLNVARKSSIIEKLNSERVGAWKGILQYDVLKLAALHPSEEIRILSLSVVAESPKATELFSAGDFDFIAWFLKYNMNTQSPNFRQLTLSVMKKFFRRIQDSYKMLMRQKKSENTRDMYLQCIEKLKDQCYDSLIPGANYSRRVVALQLLVWCEQLDLEGYSRLWKNEYIGKLLNNLDDSYESNKALVLEILEKCPRDVLICYKHNALSLEYILQEASSVKPTDCTSAAYKLELKQKLTRNKEDTSISNYSTYKIIIILLEKLKQELQIASHSILLAASEAPMYGLLHCICHLLRRINPNEISEDSNWSTLISEIIEISIKVNETVAPVVNNSSPEGHLPMDLEPGAPHLEGFGVRMENGNKITAQMVLLCAWRSVKEVSLMLGEIASSLTIEGEESSETTYTLTQEQVMTIGEHFTMLLAETKHRGAFEQAYLGFTKLLTRLWRCRGRRLHSLPRGWLTVLMKDIAVGGGDHNALCSTRRSAGLPFMIQALVTTELQILGNPKCFHECMATLLKLADRNYSDQTCVETRTHSLNILRALFKHTTLGETVSSYIADGLVTAINGFDGSTWAERNSSTLLFSALIVRVFGVQRSRDADKLCVRNRMTGRIFFLRFPRLYDFMLEKLKDGSCNDDTGVMLRPSLYPVLLLLARLYPSSLEGTVSNLTLVAFIPHVLSCAGSRVLKTRQLAAKAIVPLISPEQYMGHLVDMFAVISDVKVKRNFCDGILLQISKLLQERPDNLTVNEEAVNRLSKYFLESVWIVEQSLGKQPCYIIVDEYVKIINLVLWRTPSLLPLSIFGIIENKLEELLFSNNTHSIPYSGKDICLANVAYLSAIIFAKFKPEKLSKFIIKCLSHMCYEVLITVLNILLILYGNIDFEIENTFTEHLSKIIAKSKLADELQNDENYIKLLCMILKENKYMECTQKALAILSMENDTQKEIVNVKCFDEKITDSMVIPKLLKCIENEHETLTHIYMKSLTKYITQKMMDKNINALEVMDVIRSMYKHSSSKNNELIRNEIVNFVVDNYENLMQYKPASQNFDFEYHATIWALFVMLLEDDQELIRQKISEVICNISNMMHIKTSHLLLPSRCGEILRSIIAKYHENSNDAMAILLVLALLNFKSEVCITDDLNDECRVFDQNERYNVFLEETVWSKECTNKLIQICDKRGHTTAEIIPKLIENDVYKNVLRKLCDSNFESFKTILRTTQETQASSTKHKETCEIVNPKIYIVVNMLKFSY